MRRIVLTEKLDNISLFSLKTPNMRAFHLSWLSFLVCFFAWFAVAPLMSIVRDEFQLTKSQIGNIIIASVSITIIARLLVGWFCDKFGPRLTYTWLLVLGAIPVISIGFAHSYGTFLIFRLAIGLIGASFVITQYHTSKMFSGNVVGTANAIAGGWGNLGGGLAQVVMPLFFAGFIALGTSSQMAWRYSMIIPGVAMLLLAFLYYRYTQDTPEGDIVALRKKDRSLSDKKESTNIRNVLKDKRVWILFLVYGCSFGMEITIDNTAALYFIDKFGVNLTTAGILAGSFGAMNIFARALGGIFSDLTSKKYGFRGRALILGGFLLLEGLGVLVFSRVDILVWSVITMVTFALFVKMSNGACYAVVPFINKKSLGMVAGIVGAGGNVGAIFMGFVLKIENFTYQTGLSVIAVFIMSISLLVLFIKPLQNAKQESELEKEVLYADSEAEYERA